MSIEGRRWAQCVLTRTDLPPRAKVVALAVAERHNGKTGQCTPGWDRIAREAGISKDTMRRAKADLQGAGVLDVQPRQQKEGRGRTSDSYALRGVDGVAPKVWDKHPNADLVREDQERRGATLVTDQERNAARPRAHDGATKNAYLRDQERTVRPEPIREPVRGNLKENLEVGPFDLDIDYTALPSNGNGRPTQGRPNDRRGREGVVANGDRPHDSVSSNGTSPYPADVSFKDTLSAKQRADAEWLASPEGQAAERRFRRKWRLRPEDPAPTPQEVSQP